MVRMTLGRVVVGGAKVAVVSAAFLLGFPDVAHAEWPQWRGPERDGSVPADARRTDWPERLVLLWEREVGGGHSGPVVARDRVWVHARKGGEERVLSLALDDGAILWSRGDAVHFEQNSSAREHGLGPYSTPSLAGGHLFTLGVTAILSAWEAEEGTLLWRKEYSKEFDPSFPFFGAAASPLVWGNLCFVHFGGWEAENLASPTHGAMVALRIADGGEQWRWDGDGPALGASPVISQIEGRWQLIFKSTEQIVGLDPRTGEELWRIPFKVGMDNTIVTPLVMGNRILTSDREMGLLAWGIQEEDERWTTRKIWRTREVDMWMSSPVVSGSQVIGFSNLRKGQLFGLDPDNGKLLWRGDPGWGEHASLIAWGDDVLVFLEDGSLIVGEASSDRFRSLRTYRLGRSGMWGHPAIVDNRIVIKDGDRLAVYRLGNAVAQPQ
jgi:outer membrane protein assembly factor BamB